MFSKDTKERANQIAESLRAGQHPDDYISGFCRLEHQTAHLDGHFTVEELLALAMVLEEKAGAPALRNQSEKGNSSV